MMGNTMKQLFSLALILPLLLIGGISDSHADANNEFLDMDITSLMQVQITSVSRKTQNMADAATAIFVITQKDLHDAGVTSIPEALRMVPGLQVARISSSKWAITSRGFNGRFANKLLVQIDGRSVYSPAFSGVYWDVQDVMLEDIDRIEIIRGPGATLWGANAVNGIINIITKPANETLGALVSFGSGSLEKTITACRYGEQIYEDIQGRAFFQYHNQDSFTLERNNQNSNSDWKIAHGGFRLDGTFHDHNFWTLQGDIYRENGDQQVQLSSMAPPYATTVKDSFTAGGGNILGHWQHELSATSSWDFQLYYDKTSSHEVYLDQRHQTIDLDFQHHFQAGSRHDLIWGWGHRTIIDDFDNSWWVNFDPDEQTTHLYSAFIQDEITLQPDRLWLTLGTKYEHNDYTGSELQPSARLRWQLLDHHTLWAAVSRAVRTPSRVEDSAEITLGVIPLPPPLPGYPIKIQGNSHLKAEKLIAYEAGYRYYPSLLFSTDITIYYNDYQKLGAAKMPSALKPLVFNNQLEGHSYGLEIANSWHPLPWLNFDLAYSYIKLQLKTKSASTVTIYEIIGENSSPRHQISLRTGLNLGERLHLNLWTRYVDRLKDPSPQAHDLGKEINDYLAVDANVTWQPQPGLELMLAGKNLFDSKHLEFIQESFAPSTEIERSFFGKVTWKF
jgi:iron complex outermembrane receptor protein